MSLFKVSLNGIKQYSLKFPAMPISLPLPPFPSSPSLKLRLMICFQGKVKEGFSLNDFPTFSNLIHYKYFYQMITYFISLS